MFVAVIVPKPCLINKTISPSNKNMNLKVPECCKENTLDMNSDKAKKERLREGMNDK